MVHRPHAAAERVLLKSGQPVDASPGLADDLRDSGAIEVLGRELANRVEAAGLDGLAELRGEILELQRIVQLEALAASADLKGVVTDGVPNSEIASAVPVEQEIFAGLEPQQPLEQDPCGLAQLPIGHVRPTRVGTGRHRSRRRPSHPAGRARASRVRRGSIADGSGGAPRERMPRPSPRRRRPTAHLHSGR